MAGARNSAYNVWCKIAAKVDLQLVGGEMRDTLLLKVEGGTVRESRFLLALGDPYSGKPVDPVEFPILGGYPGNVV